MAKLNEVAAALERFRSAGKQILAWGSQMSQAQYYLAAHADQVYLHPSGAVLLTGLGGYRNYYRDALDRLGVTVNVFRVGKYKSFVEPFVNNAPSREAQEAESFWLNDAWTSYTGQVEQARKLPTGALGRMIDELPVRLGAAGGDLAKLALSEKLVDALMTRDELRALLIIRPTRPSARCRSRSTATGCPTAATAVRRWRWWSCRATSSMAMPRRARSVVVRRPS